jgi:hypothetical protein
MAVNASTTVAESCVGFTGPHYRRDSVSFAGASAGSVPDAPAGTVGHRPP